MERTQSNLRGRSEEMLCGGVRWAGLHCAVIWKRGVEGLNAENFPALQLMPFLSIIYLIALHYYLFGKLKFENESITGFP